MLKQREALEKFGKQCFSEETIKEENKQSIFQGTVQVNKIPVSFSERLVIDKRAAIWTGFYDMFMRNGKKEEN